MVVVGHALHDGPHQVGAGGGQRQVVEPAAHVAVGDRCALAREPRGEDRATGARRRPGGEGREVVEAARVGGGVAVTEQPVGGRHQVVAQPLEAQARRVVVVGQQVAPVEPGDAGHAVQHVGLLARHGEADPRRRAERHVRLAGAERPRPDGGGVEVGHPGHDLHAGRQPEVGGDVVAHGADDRAGRDERGQLRAVDAGPADEVVVVGEDVEAAVVGEPGRGHRRVGGRGHAGEAHGEVVDRLEVPAGGGGDVGVVRRQVEHVPHRVVAAGDARGLADPDGQRPRVVARHGAADALAGEADAPVVLPHDAVADRDALGVDRHGAGPLAGDAHGHHPGGRHVAVGEDLADGVGDDRPPLARVLDRSAAVEPAGGDRHVVLPRHPARDRHEPDLGPAGPEVDGEDEVAIGCLARRRPPPSWLGRSPAPPELTTGSGPACRAGRP